MSTVNKGLISYDRTRMGGVTGASAESLWQAKSAMLERMRGSEPGFFTLPERAADLRAVERLARDISKKAKTLIVLGIGGSDLGARAIIRALATPGKGMDVRFLEAGADPDELATLIAAVDLKRCAINVVSKSGDTLEPLANFLVLRELLEKRVGRKAAATRIVVTTNETKGALLEMAKREGYSMLLIPADVGGRFSALTPVGLFPALCAGISGRKLLGGAASVRDTFVAEAAEKNAALLFAGLHHAHYAEHERRVTVLMPYAASLRELALWFRQLWAESLGKAKTRGGKVMPVGFTPVAALGPADQHSQLQLWNEGPDDAVITLLTVDKSRFDPVMPRFHVDLAPPRLLARKRMSVLLRAEIEATAQTLASHGRPNGTLAIGRVTPETVGGLMMFFMLATAATAELLDIDAYGQPGVEEDKRLIRESLRDS